MISLKEWNVHFDPNCEPISSLEVWVILPGLPLVFCYERILECIGSKIGRFVCLEKD
jgi:hypothetical protein